MSQEVPTHVATIIPKKILVLRQLEWHVLTEKGKEEPTGVKGESIPEAIENGYREWRLNSFQPLLCGICYTLPERDEIGRPALFCEMARSQKSFNGNYFDEELGHECFVQFTPQEALDILDQYFTL